MTEQHSKSSFPTPAWQDDAMRTLGRRRFVTAAVAGGLLLPTYRVVAQTAPPIEQRGAETPLPDQEIIEPEVPPTISPSEDADTIANEVESNSVRYFAETGHNLDEPFLSAWALTGERAGPGVPISEPRLMEDDGTIRQDFEAIALLYNPNAESSAALQAVALPDSAIAKIVPAANRQQDTGAGYSLSGPIAQFWQDHGGEQLLGLPRSEPISNAGKTTQVFDNVVLEQDSAGRVTMRKVNTDLANQQFPDDPAFMPAPPSLGTSWLVTASDGLRLRSAPEGSGTVIAVLPDNAEFVAAPGDHGGWVPGYVDGFSGWVSADFLTTNEGLTEVATTDWRLDVWEGMTLGDTNRRREASTSSQSLGVIPYQTPIVVTGWVRGEPVVETQITWAQLDDGSYVYARNIGRAAPIEPPSLPADAPSEGRWIDVHLTQQLMVAYEGRTPVRTVVMTSGMPGWETPPGFFQVNHRVANETMESGSIGAEDFYVLKNVLFTQYFTDRGHALHYAWWKNAETIGRPGSHGCLNLLMEDAQFFWDWATIGTPVVCRTV
jgi:hypothetical protein